MAWLPLCSFRHIYSIFYNTNVLKGFQWNCGATCQLFSSPASLTDTHSFFLPFDLLF